MTLAEVIADAERLLERLRDTVERGDGFEWRQAKTDADAFASSHFSTLVAVARAAVEREKAERTANLYARDAATNVLRAAVRGEKDHV